jgi:hypothetical protein
MYYLVQLRGYAEVGIRKIIVHRHDEPEGVGNVCGIFGNDITLHAAGPRLCERILRMSGGIHPRFMLTFWSFDDGDPDQRNLAIPVFEAIVLLVWRIQL